MASKFTTTLKAGLIRDAKIEAIRSGKQVNDLLELGLRIVISRSKVLNKK
jgi:urease gamma subunit